MSLIFVSKVKVNRSLGTDFDCVEQVGRISYGALPAVQHFGSSKFIPYKKPMQNTSNILPENPLKLPDQVRAKIRLE